MNANFMQPTGRRIGSALLLILLALCFLQIGAFIIYQQRLWQDDTPVSVSTSAAASLKPAAGSSTFVPPAESNPTLAGSRLFDLAAAVAPDLPSETVAEPKTITLPQGGPPTFTILGIVIRDDKAIGLIRHPETGETLSVVEGDHVDDWRIDRIAGRKIIFFDGESRFALSLFERQDSADASTFSERAMLRKFPFTGTPATNLNDAMRAVRTMRQLRQRTANQPTLSPPQQQQ